MNEIIKQFKNKKEFLKSYGVNIINDVFTDEWFEQSLKQVREDIYKECLGKDSFYRTIMDSKEWKEWYKVQEGRLAKQGKGRVEDTFDISESTECNLISPEHWSAFIKWIKI